MTGRQLRPEKEGRGDPGTRVLFLVHCTRINLCCSNFPLLVVHKNAPPPARAPAPSDNTELGLSIWNKSQKLQDIPVLIVTRVWEEVSVQIRLHTNF